MSLGVRTGWVGALKSAKQSWLSTAVSLGGSWQNLAVRGVGGEGERGRLLLILLIFLLYLIIKLMVALTSKTQL